jgi:ACS family hexuronate transporter-like MFS transporter
MQESRFTGQPNRMRLGLETLRGFDSGLYWILAIISIYNYLDRTSLSALIATVGPDLHITNLVYGFAGNAFFATYTILYLFGGRLADRFGPLPVLFISLAIWSAAELLQGFITGAVSLCLVRALLGAGEGPFYAIAAKTLSQNFSAEKRANPLALILAAGQVGAIISVPALSLVTAHVGWRISFVLLGLGGFVLLIISKLSVASPLEKKPHAEKVNTLQIRKSSTKLRHIDSLFIRLLVVRAVTDATYYFYVFWMPKYFHDVQHFSQAQIGHYLWVPYMAGFMGAIVSGRLLSFAMANQVNAVTSRKPLFVVSGLLAMTGGITALTLSAPLALIALSIACFGHLAWITLIYGAIIDAAPVNKVGFLFGLSGAAGSLASVFSQPVIGAIIDKFGYPSIFLACSVTMLAGVAAVTASGSESHSRDVLA